jgi:type II secretory pathway component GspD/PulD (secretin)
LADGAVMIANADGKPITAAALQFLEVEGRMIVIASPEIVVLPSQPANMRR